MFSAQEEFVKLMPPSTVKATEGLKVEIYMHQMWYECIFCEDIS